MPVRPSLLPVLIWITLPSCAWLTDAEIDDRLDADDDGIEIGDDCDDGSPTVGAAAPWYADGDGDGYGVAASSRVACDRPDGYAAATGDCDDADGSVNPAATEVCNGADDDCDGTTDEPDAQDAATWYADADGDDYGDPTTPAEACSQPDGFVADGSDCDDADAGLNPGTIWYADADGDAFGDPDGTVVQCEEPTGHVLDATDCDDGDGDVNPDADEICNEVDDDCDDATDEPDAIDAATWYADADADGYGDPATPTQSCPQPDGFVADATDCDDGDEALNPETAWYADLDEDGSGDAASVLVQCEPPAGHVLEGADCDDGDAAFHPGATEDDCTDPNDYNCDGSTGYADVDADGWAACVECDDADEDVNPDAIELCNGLDDDCDAATDEDDAADAPTWYADADGDGYGDATASARACAAPADHVGVSGDCDDASSARNPGVAEIVANGVDEDCDGSETCYADADGDGFGGESTVSGSLACSGASEAGASTDCDDASSTTFPGAAPLDSATDCMADEDDDGYGARYATSPVEAGSDCDDEDDSLVLDCFVGGTIALSTADMKLVGVASSDQAGAYVTGVGDLDGDGKDEVAISALYANVAGSTPIADTGAVYIVSSGTTSLAAPYATWNGISAGDFAGSVAAIGDVTGDGVADLVIGAALRDGTAADGLTPISNAGAAYIVSGAATGTWSLSSATATLLGEADDDAVGYSVTGGGDLTNDLVDDVVIGAHGTGIGGAVYVVKGGALSGSKSLSTSTDVHAKLTGSTAYAEEVGHYVSGGRNVNYDVSSDGWPDLLVSTPSYRRGSSTTGAMTGGVYVVLGPVPSGTTTLASAADWTLQGENEQDGVGDDAALVGDVDGDGKDDILVGAYGHDDGSTTQAGAAYLVLGRAAAPGTVELKDVATAKLAGESDRDFAGHAVASAGDVDRDGRDDLLVGAYQDPDLDSGSGRAYLVLGDSVSTGTFSLGSAADAIFTGETEDDLAGIAVGSADIDGDGWSDVLIGASGYDDGSSKPDAGAVYVLFGRGL
jgi:hypothetical protein